MKHPTGFFALYYDGKNLWIDGHKKRQPETYTNIIKAIEARNVEYPTQGNLEIFEDGETTFYPEVVRD